MGIFIATLFAAWRLSTGPVSLSFLTPVLQSSLNELHDGSIKITLDDTILTWAGWERTLDIRMVNMQASLIDGGNIASVPEVSVSFSAGALVKGIIAPRSIEFFGPDLLVVRGRNGGFDFGFEGGPEGEGNSGGFVTKILGAMLQQENELYPMSYLSRVNIVAGQLTYLDNTTGVTWYAPMADARLRRSDAGLEAELDLGVDVDGKTANLSVLGSFYSNLHRVDLGVSFSSLNPSSLVGLLPQIDVVSTIDIPLSGTITLSTKTDGNIEGVGFDLSGEAGYISLPVPLASKLDLLPFAQRIKVDGLKVTGRFDGKYRNIEINNLDVQLADNETIYLPSPLDMELPFKRISLAGRYMGEERRVEIEGAEIDLGGPIAKIRAKVNGVNWPGSVVSTETPGAIALGLSGVLHDMSLEGLERYWPRIVAPDARKWVLEHMPKGISPKAEMVVSLVSDKDGVRIDTLEGSIEGQDVTINYLPPMPAVTGAKGVATFDADSFDIYVTSADSHNGVTPNVGDIHFTKLNTNSPIADFDLDLSGSISGALALIDHDPLNFAEVIGIDPQKTSGSVEANLKIHFPFRKDLSVSDVSVNATANLVNAEFSEILFERNLSMGNLQLEVSNAELSAVGTAQLGGVPVGLLWRHDFATEAIFRDKYELTGRIDNVLGLGDMGI
ncbi:MAG: hypothetical protein KAR80_03260, partial [Rhodospirillaceae bacterium]|nr:hypothetical protein [Rhodospirillaceae bacterium]